MAKPNFKKISALAAALVTLPLPGLAQTFYWNRNPVISNQNDFNRAYNWSSNADGTGSRPYSTTDDDFTSATLDPAWTPIDADNDPATGAYSLTANTGQMTLTARGSDVFGSINEFYALHRDDMYGDIDVTVKVVAQTNTHSAAKAGIMITEDFTNPNGKTFAYVAARPDGTVEFAYDGNATPGIETVTGAGVGLTLPIWLRIVRINSYQSISAYYKTTLSGNWIQIGGTASIYGSVVSPISVGLFACSHNPTGTMTAVFDDFQGGTRIKNSGYALSMHGTSGTALVNATVTSDINAAGVDFTGYTGVLNFGRANGLAVTYFDHSQFNGSGVTKVDPDINFNWGAASPDPAIALHPVYYDWSARWEGQVQPAFSETYTFYVNDDGPRQLWVNNQLIVNVNGTGEYSGTIALTAGVKVPIRLEYNHNSGSASAVLSWSSASQTKAPIPNSALFAGKLHASGDVSFYSGMSVASGPGVLDLNGTGAQTLIPMNAVVGPAIDKTGSGTVTVSTNALWTGQLNVYGGTWNWGSLALTHLVSAIATSGSASMTFGSNTVKVNTGDCNFSGLASLSAGTGTLEFSGASNQIFTPAPGATHPNIRQSGTGTTTVSTNNLTLGNLDVTAGTFDISTNARSMLPGGNVNVTGGHLLATNGPMSVSGDITVSSGTFDCPGSGVFFGLAGSFTHNSGATLLNNGGTLTLNGTSIGKSLNIYGSLNNVTLNGTGGVWTLNNNLTISGNLLLTAGTLDVSATVMTASVFNLGLSGGTLVATNGNLHVNGAFDMGSGSISCPAATKSFTISGSYSQTGGTFTPGDGTITLDGALTGRTLIALNALNSLSIIGSGGWIAATDGFTTGSLSLSNGSLDLGTGLTHTVSNSLTLSAGTLNFNTSILQVAATTVNLNSLGTLSNTSGRLEFTGVSAQTFTPKFNVTHPDIKQNGTGGTTIVTYGLTTPVLTISAGTLYLGTGLTHSVTSSLGTTGGGLDFGTSTLQVAAASVSLGSLASLTAGSGTLKFTGSSAQTFTPKSGSTHPSIVQYGTGGTTVATNGLITGSLTLNQGTFNLGSSLIHTVTSVSDGGAGPYGNLDFGSSQLHVTGNVALGNTPTLTAGTGSLYFEGTTGTQVFTPKSGGATHPAVFHTGNSTLQINMDLTCLGFNQSAGIFNLNGFNVTTTGAHDFIITNGTSTSLTGLSARTLTVGGNASFTGVSGSNRVGLNPAAAWTLAVTGTLTATNADLANNTASVSAGTCTDCNDGGVNANWTMPITWNGGGANNNWNTAGNWACNSIPTSVQDAIFNGTSVKSVIVDVNTSIHSVTLTNAYTGDFSFSVSTLNVTGNADFRSSGTITAGSGFLSFSGAAAQTFYPKSGATFPDIFQSGTGGTTISTNGLNMGALSITSGTLNLGGGLTHTATNVSTSGGGLNFGSSTLRASGAAVNLSGLATLTAGTGTLELNGTSTQAFTPKSAATLPSLVKSGAGTVTLASYGINTASLSISAGTFNLGPSLSHTVTTTLSMSGGGLDFSSSTLSFGGTTVDFSNLASLTPGTGTFEFTNGAGNVSFTPKSSLTFPIIKQNGLSSAGTSIIANNLTAKWIQIASGTFDFGSSSSTVDSITSSGGGISSNGTVHIATGNLSLAGVTSNSGNATFSFDAPTGTQIFTPMLGATYYSIAHPGAGTLQLSGNNLTCYFFNQSGGVLDFNAKNLTIANTTGSNITVTNGTAASIVGLAGRTITVNGNASFSGTSAANKLNLNPVSAWTLTVTGTLTANLASLAKNVASSSAGSCTNCADGGGNSNWTFATAWSGAGADNNWSTPQNWGGGAIPTSSDNIVFDATSVKNATLDAAANVNSIVFTNAYTGTFSFSSSTLTVSGGNADFRSGGSFSAGTGALNFTSGTAQTFFPKSGATFPNIIQNGAGGTTISTNPLTAGNLTVTSGTFTLGSGFTHTVSGVSGTGTLALGSSNLNITGNADFSLMAGVTGTGALAFTGTSAQTFTPKSATTYPPITQNGPGGTTVLTTGFTTPTLSIASGTLNLGTTLSHSVTTTLNITGGGLNFGSATLAVQATTVNFSSLGSLTAGTGTLLFTGTSAQSFTPKAAGTHPNITQYGSGGTTILTNGLTAGALTLNQGTFNLGSSLSHAFSSVSDGGGGPYGNLDFNSSTMHVTGSVLLGNVPTLTAGTGTLAFEGASGTQVFVPRASGATHPAITHTGAGTLQIATNDLTCKSFTQTNGGLDFNGRNLTVNGGGNLSISNGTSSTMTGLGSRTITVAGNASLDGTSGTNQLDLNPGSAWTLAVTGTLTSNYSSLSSCNASASAGSCSNCANGGSNTNWTFSISWIGTGADKNWTTASNWGSNTVPTSAEDALFNAGGTGDVTLNANESIHSITFATGYTGTMDFSTNTLSVGGNADFHLIGGVTPGAGALAFVGTTAHTFYPKSGAIFPGIIQNGSGQTEISTNSLIAGNVTVSSGTLRLGPGMTHTFNSLSGTGTIDFESSNLNVTGNSDLSGLTIAGSGNTITFVGTSAQSFTPNLSATALNYVQNGAGGTTIHGNGIATSNLTLTSGTFSLGSGLTHTVSTFTATGGALDFGSSTLQLSGATVNFSALTSITPGTGVLKFTGSSAQAFTPKSGATFPGIVQSGSGVTTITTNPLTAGALSISAGTFDLGSAFTHNIASLTTTGGSLAFNGSTLRISSGDADFTGLSSLSSGTGTLEFQASGGTQTLSPKASTAHPNILHSGAGTLRLATNPLSCLSVQLGAGTFDLNGMNVTTTVGNFTLTNGSSASFLGLDGRTLTVAGNASFDGQAGNLANMNPGTSWTLAVTGTLNANHINLAHCNASASDGTAGNSTDGGGNTKWTFAVTWTGGGVDNNWTTGANWGSGVAPGATIAVVFDNTSSKNLTLDAEAAARSVTFTTGYTGAFSFTSHTLSIASGNADFRSGGSFTPGTGILAFVGTGAQTFIPKSGSTFPAITQNGSGTTTVSTNSLSAGDLTISAGTFNLGTGGLTHSVASLSGAGNLDFSGSTLQVTGNADMSSLASITPGSGTLALVGGGSHSFTPKIGATLPPLSLTGAGSTLVLSNGFTTSSLSMNGGLLDLGAGLTHTITGTLTLTGGSLNFSSSNLKVGSSAVDLSSLSAITPGTGSLEFMGASPQTFKPKSGVNHPKLIQSGSGGTSLAAALFAAPSLTISNGTVDLGTGFTHTFSSISAVGGGMIFNNSQARVDLGNVDFSGLATLQAGTGSLNFSAATGKQSFTPKAGATHPGILHSGADTLRLAINSLNCLSFNQTAGSLDFNGVNLSVTGSGTFAISNGGAASLLNLGGRTLTIGGNAALHGLPGGHLLLNPASIWTLAVTGTLTAADVDMRNSLASVAAGIADSSLNLGGNSNWTFLDSIKPDNVTLFQATALGGHSVRLAWTSSVSPDADSVMFRYRTDGVFPTSPTDGQVWRTVPKSHTSDTATGLPDKTIYNFGAFVKDSSGNWSLPTADSKDTARTPDVTPPANVTAFTATAISPTSAALSWTSPTTSDADSIYIRYRATGAYPSNSTDGTLWKSLPVAKNKDTVTSLAGNTVYYFGLFVRDSSANFTAASTGAQDTALYQAPVNGGVTISDLQGVTSDVDPALTFSSAGADSMRFSLLADTAAAPWKAVHATDSVSMASGADGRRIVAVQFKNTFGTRSPWYRDTTSLDRQPPTVTVNLSPNHSYRNWPNKVAGRALDSISGTDTVSVIRKRLTDGTYYNGSGWSTVPDTSRLRADSTYSMPMPSSAMTTGDYVFTVFARDRLGHVSTAVQTPVHYDENRAPVLATGNIADTVAQNAPVDWTLDFGDKDLADSVFEISATFPAWLKSVVKQDTGYGGFAAHLVYHLTGAPAQADVGANALNVQVRDAGGKTFIYSKNFFVLDVNDAPVFADSQSTLNVTQDSTFLWNPKYTDADPKDKHTIAILSAPAWVKMTDSTVVFKPRSRDVGVSNIRLTVSDGNLLDTLQTAVTVINVNDPPFAFPSDNWHAQAMWKEDVVDTFNVVVVDMDKGDSIRVATALPAFISYKSKTDTANPYNRFFKFTVNPRRVDTGSYSLKLRFTDSAGAASELLMQGKVEHTNHPPLALIKGQQSLAGAARIQLDVQDQDGDLSTTRFHYRLINLAGDTLRSGITASPSLDLHPLADGDFIIAVMAEDQEGLKQAAFTTAPLHIFGATSLALDSGRWNMIGCPGRSLSLSALGAGAGLSTWDEVGSVGQPGSYTSGKAVDSLRRGKGYWARVMKSTTLTAAQSDLLTQPFTMKLLKGKQGWNQIGNPFPYYVDLSTTGLQFWEWDAGKRDLINSRGLLKPWGAYWVQVPKDSVLIVKDDPYFPANGAPVPKIAANLAPNNASAQNWSLQLSLSAGPYQDQANYLGIRNVTPGGQPSPAKPISNAAQPLTGSDLAQIPSLPDAPKYGDFIALHFEKAGTSGDSLAWGYATDFRDNLDADEEWWDFAVQNKGSGFDKAVLAVPGLQDLAAAGLYAFIVRRGVAMPLAPNTDAVLPMESELTHYSFVVTPHADFAERLKGDFSISQNFPNPVSTFTSFRFFLPQAWDADGKRIQSDYKLRINVYDFQGRLAAQVTQGSFKPGSHTLLWKPQTKGGSPLAKGSYLYRLETSGFVKTLKMAVQ